VDSILHNLPGTPGRAWKVNDTKGIRGEVLSLQARA
jgi:hypothetical protein